MSSYLQKLETYADLEVTIIRATKINKVLKAIIKLNFIPMDDEYNFRGRSMDILWKWKNLLDSDMPTTGAVMDLGAIPGNAGVNTKAKSDGELFKIPDNDVQGALKTVNEREDAATECEDLLLSRTVLSRTDAVEAGGWTMINSSDAFEAVNVDISDATETATCGEGRSKHGWEHPGLTK